MPEQTLGPGRRIYLAVEFLLLFVVVPPLLAFGPVKAPPIVLLWPAAGACWMYLRMSPTFNAERLWQWPAGYKVLLTVLVRFLIAGLALTLLVRLLWPEAFLSFPRRRPDFWGLVMVLYPILSVIPQGIVYRAFLFHRYRPLFKNGLLFYLIGSLAFAWAHVIFKNPAALALTAVGGLLFARTYLKSESLLMSSLEHALYGDLAFTVGLGMFLYHGAVR